MDVGLLAVVEPRHMHADIPPDTLGIVRAGLRAAETPALWDLLVRRAWGHPDNLRRAFDKLLANLLLYREHERASAGVAAALRTIAAAPLRPTLQAEPGTDLRALHWWGPAPELTPMRLGCLEEDPVAATALHELLDRGALLPDADPASGHVVLRPPPHAFSGALWRRLRPWVAGAFVAHLAARGCRGAERAAGAPVEAVESVEAACAAMMKIV